MRGFLGAAVLLFSITFFSNVSNAQMSVCGERVPDSVERSPLMFCNIVGDTLYIDGPIDPLIIDELAVYDTEEKIRRIELNSFGGNIVAIQEMAKIIRARGMTTNVRKDAICMSACMVLYQAGITRTAHSSARFMVHTVRNSASAYKYWRRDCDLNGPEWCEQDLQNRIADLEESTLDYFGWMQLYGQSPRLFDDFISNYPKTTNPEQILEYQKDGNFLLRANWYMTAEETMEYGVVQELTAGD